MVLLRLTYIHKNKYVSYVGRFKRTKDAKKKINEIREKHKIFTLHILGVKK